MAQVTQRIGRRTLVELFTDTSKTSLAVPAWAKTFDILLVGGGGAGGGINIAGGAANAGGGGGGGALELHHVNCADISSFTCAIGAGGTGVAAATGNNGGFTSITGVLYSGIVYAKGGVGGTANGIGDGGTYGLTSTAGGGGAGGGAGSIPGTDGAITLLGPERGTAYDGGGGGGGNNLATPIGGSGGGSSNLWPKTITLTDQSASGGSSRYGAGAQGRARNNPTGGTGVSATIGYGGGGSGAYGAVAGANYAGGDGKSGCIRVKWYG